MAYQQFITSAGEDFIDSEAQAFETYPITHIFFALSIACEYPTISIPSMGQVHELSANGINVADPTITTRTEPFVPQISQVHHLSPVNITSAPVILSTPKLVQHHVLSMPDVLTTASVISLPRVEQYHLLLGQDIVISNPVIATTTELFITADGDVFINAGGDVFRPELNIQASPQVTQTHQLLADNLVPAPMELKAPGITQHEILTASDIWTGVPLLSSPAAEQVHSLSYPSIITGNPIIPICTFTQAIVLSMTSITAGIPIVETPSLYVSDVFSGGGERIAMVPK
jgi:hypothetical protein